MFGDRSSRDDDIESARLQAKEMAKISSDLEHLTLAVNDLKTELKTRDDRYYELLKQNQELCNSAHNRLVVVEKSQQKVIGDVSRLEDSSVKHEQLVAKFESVLGVDCKSSKDRDIARASFRWLMEVNNESLDDIIRWSEKKRVDSDQTRLEELDEAIETHHVLKKMRMSLLERATLWAFSISILGVETYKTWFLDHIGFGHH